MRKFFIVFAVLIFVFALVPLQSNAAGLTQCGGTGQPACGLCDIFKLIATIINFFLFPDLNGPNKGLAAVPLLAAFFIALGGFYILLAGQDPKRIDEGKKILTTVVVGLIIVYTAWLFVGFFLKAFGVAEWTGIWWQIPCAVK